MDYKELLKKAVTEGVSDVLLAPNSPPVFKNDKNIEKIGEELSAEDTREIVNKLLTRAEQEEYEHTGHISKSYSVPGVSRFRVSFFKQRSSNSLSVRVLGNAVPEFEDLNLPYPIKEYAYKTKGLAIISGPAGSGRTTTLSALVNEINNTRASHVITLESPIEYLHEHREALVNQREIGQDCINYYEGLKSALKQSPDVLVVGEMQDAETIETALLAAESGCLVLASLRSFDVVQAIEDIIESYPDERKQQARIKLANNLLGISVQRLVNSLKGKIPITEIMTYKAEIARNIKNNYTDEIISIMENSTEMHTMEQKIAELYNMEYLSAGMVEDYAKMPEKIIESRREKGGEGGTSSPG